MSAAAGAAGWLYASGKIRRREHEQKPALQAPKTPAITYRKRKALIGPLDTQPRRPR